MESIKLTNYRSFAKGKEIRIAPITFLVGENNAGKSSLLAAVKIAIENLTRFNISQPPNFNEEPFHLGAFDDILSSSANERKFRIEHTFSEDGKKIEISAQYINKSGQPILNSFLMREGEYGIQFNHSPDDSASEHMRIDLSFPSGKTSLRYGRLVNPEILAYILQSDEYRNIFAARDQHTNNDLAISKEDRIRLANILTAVARDAAVRVYAFAPIRSHPQRIYDFYKNQFSVNGEHVPHVLYKKGGDSRLFEVLRAFGKESGLFEDIKVSRLNKKSGGPFQLLFKVNSKYRNIIDIGYGVSQGLPIVVDIENEPNDTLFLLQQPEVHLHPKAQVAFGSYLFNQFVNHKKRFIIETHSDFIIDRVRTEIRQRLIAPENVSIAYFEYRNKNTRVYNLSIDAEGNIINAPASYRSFFMQEMNRNLGL